MIWEEVGTCPEERNLLVAEQVVLQWDVKQVVRLKSAQVAWALALQALVALALVVMALVASAPALAALALLLPVVGAVSRALPLSATAGQVAVRLQLAAWACPGAARLDRGASVSQLGPALGPATHSVEPR